MDEALAELRALMLGTYQGRVDRVETWLSDENAFVGDVSKALPRAIAQRKVPDRALSRALVPSVEEALQTSVKRNPKALIDAIFPILGPAIRKAIAQAMSGLVDGINRNVEATLTPRGMRWRFEAWRTGRSYGDVVLAHSIVYRVEQVYLIHKETGLLLNHVGPMTPTAEDPDVVSSMFTAIQDFVRDAFPSGRGGSLDQVHVGDLTLLGEYGPRALLAVVVRGTPPRGLSTRMQRTIEHVHAEWKQELAHYKGDNAPFRATVPLLEDCLVAEDKPKRKSWAGPVVLTVAAAALVLFLLSTFLRGQARHDRWEDYLARLERAPGFVVVSTSSDGDRYELRGLRDPLAEDTAPLLSAAGLSPGDVEEDWEPYFAADPGIVVARARQALEAPQTIELRLEGSVLHAKGNAPRRWLVAARRRAAFLPGVTEFVSNGFFEDTVDGWREQVRAALVFFDHGEEILSLDEEDTLDALAKALHRLDRLALREGRVVLVDVLGRTGPEEAPSDAQALALARARAVQARLQGETWRTTRVRLGRAGEHVTTPWIPVAEKEVDGRVVGVWFTVRTPPKGN